MPIRVRHAHVTHTAELISSTVVRFQHRHYVPLTLALGFGLPALIGKTYGDTLGALLWGGVVARLLIWCAHLTLAG